MKRHPLALVLLVALSAALLFAPPAIAQEADAVSLRPVWTVGQGANYEFWSKTEKAETAELFGKVQSKKTIYISEGRVHWKVDVVNEDGSSVGTMQLKSIKFTATFGEADPIVMDSENLSGESPIFDQLLTAMVGTPLKVTVNADGTVKSVEGIEALKTAAGNDAVEADVVPEELDFIETASELASLMAAPAKATPGQTWSAKNTWNHESVVPDTDTTADWDTTFTFTSLGQIAGVPIATINSESTIDLKVDLSELPEAAAGIDVQIVEASGKSEILFDLSRHETVARNDSMSYVANVIVTPPNNQIPPVTIKVTEKSVSQLLRIAEE